MNGTKICTAAFQVAVVFLQSCDKNRHYLQKTLAEV